MSKDEHRAKPLTGEVLGPKRDEMHLPIERPLNGIPLFNRIHYRSVRRELEEYRGVLAAKNAVLREHLETQRIGEDFNRALLRTERLDDLRQIEGLKIDSELDAAMRLLIAQNRNAQADDIAHRARMARLEREAIEAEQDLEALKNPPPPPPPPPPKPDEAERIRSEIAKIRRQEKDLIAALVAEVGSEADLPEEDQELIRDVRLQTRDRIARLIEDLGR